MRKENIRLDVYAENSKGEYFDCEVQRDNEKDSYVIFITDRDYFKQNEPLYIVERKYNSKYDFDDGSHIIYVNGEYDGDDELGHLLSDLKKKDLSGFYNKELEEAVFHFKKTREGKAIMSDSFKEFTEKVAKDYYNSGRDEERASSIRSVMKNFKLTAKEAMDKLDIPKSEQSKYMAML